MIDIDQTLRAAGGLVATHELHAAGVSRGALAHLLRSGALSRVRQGWYAKPAIALHAERAARVGGVITCAAALAAHGVWAVPDGRLHVLVPRGSVRLRTPGDPRRRLSEHPSGQLTVHWLSKPQGTHRLVASAVDALSTLRRCATRELYLASLDSALHQHPDLHSALLSAGHPVGRGGIDGTCESGTETLFRLRMAPHLPSLRCQVRIPGVGRVDFLIGEALVIEIDGKGYHDTASSFEKDRRRDAALSERGFRVLRFSYRQVLEDWPTVEAAVLAAVSRGDHLR